MKAELTTHRVSLAAVATLNQLADFCRANADTVDAAFARYASDVGDGWVYLPPNERRTVLMNEARRLGVSDHLYSVLMNVLLLESRRKQDE